MHVGLIDSRARRWSMLSSTWMTPDGRSGAGYGMISNRDNCRKASSLGSSHRSVSGRDQSGRDFGDRTTAKVRRDTSGGSSRPHGVPIVVETTAYRFKYLTLLGCANTRGHLPAQEANKGRQAVGGFAASTHA